MRNTSESSPRLLADAEAPMYLRDRMRALGYNVSSFAEALNISRNQLHRLLLGKVPMSRNVAARLTEIDADCWIEPCWQFGKKADRAKKPAPGKD